MSDGTVIWAFTSLAAGLLVVAGIPKLAGRAAVPLLPKALHRSVGAIEVLVGAWALLIPGTLSAGAVAVGYVLLTAVLLIAILRREPDCGCFGVEPVRPEWGHLGINVALAAAAVAAAASSWSRPGLATWALLVFLSMVGAAMLAELLSTGAEVRRLRTSLEANR